MVNRTYRYFTADPLIPFGYGLSYTSFQYLAVHVRPEVLRFTDVMMVDVYVINKGRYDGEEVRKYKPQMNNLKKQAQLHF